MPDLVADAIGKYPPKSVVDEWGSSSTHQAVNTPGICQHSSKPA
ncbi:hypothetical protein XYCOK13_15640 [Xylanibacillus composti]|uniref:Uncharacterized protein n=1 Tax=Xylanibacillus composti TaxID=1572762 RepID=A0A8J4H326_9BACL|nr:hypothetical protein XYCOK13_15640 [Xylanibacillus composti]